MLGDDFAQTTSTTHPRFSFTRTSLRLKTAVLLKNVSIDLLTTPRVTLLSKVCVRLSNGVDTVLDAFSLEIASSIFRSIL